MKLPRKLPRPSPSMIVALFALIIASTGTAFAAQSGLIPGSHIVAHSITAKQLAPLAVNHAALGDKAIRRNNFSGPAPTECANGIIVYSGSCPAGASVYVEVTVPAGGGLINFYSEMQGTRLATASPSLGDGLSTSPNAPTALRSLNVYYAAGQAAKLPSAVVVSLTINGVTTPSFCTIQNVSPGQNLCSSDATVKIPANSVVSFVCGIIGAAAPADPTWDSFHMEISYLSLAY